MLTWFSNRSRVAQLGILVVAVAAIFTLWSLLLALVGYLLRGYIWRFGKRKLVDWLLD